MSYTIENYRISGLDCADCAARIESATAALPGVSKASVNIATGTIRIHHEEDRSGTRRADVARLVREIEPAAALVADDTGRRVTATLNPATRRRVYRTLVAAGAFAVAFLPLFAPLPHWWGMVWFALAYGLAGGDVVWNALRNVVARRPLDEHVLMTIATAGAWVLAEGGEAAAVMVFYQIGDTLQAAAVNRSRNSVAALLDLRPDTARRLVDNTEEEVAASRIVPGDMVVCRPGERIPVDGVVESGRAALNTAAITGEAVPAVVEPGDAVHSGTVCLDARLVICATAAEAQSTVARLLSLVEEAATRKAPTERTMTRLARVYTPLVVIVAAVLALVPPVIFGAGYAEWFYRAMVFLVVSCPCALVVSIPLGYFAGIGAASRQGILIKGGNYLDALARVTTVAFDKTGTVTTGEFAVSDVTLAPFATGTQVLHRAAYLATAATSHPVSLAVRSWLEREIDDLPDGRTGTDVGSGETTVQEIAGRGVVVTATFDPNHEPQRTIAGSAEHLREQGIVVPPGTTGTALHVARDETYLGAYLVEDRLRPRVEETVSALRRRGVRQILLLSGDNQRAADSIGTRIGVDRTLGALLPHQKVQVLESLIGAPDSAGGGGRVAFVGDGINDAAVIARADVGIAMGGIGSDAAVEAADVVIMGDSPELVVRGMDIAAFTRRIVTQNIVAALGIKVLFLSAAAAGLATMWMAVFADVGVTLLTVLNTLRILRHRHSETDTVTPTQ